MNVCDASSDEFELHLDVTNKLLSELGCSDRPIISVFNKCDLVKNPYDLPMGKESVRICAKMGIGIDELLRAIEKNLPVRLRKFTILLPFDKASVIAVLRKAGALQSEEYTADGIKVEAVVEEPLWHLVEGYSTNF